MYIHQLPTRHFCR